jgi:hypothetical protein
MGILHASSRMMREQGWCIDPNAGDKPEFGKIDAQTNSE